MVDGITEDLIMTSSSVHFRKGYPLEYTLDYPQGNPKYILGGVFFTSNGEGIQLVFSTNGTVSGRYKSYTVNKN